MTTGEADIELMNAVGYDVAIPGNHEFDYGMERFLELTEMADFPPTSAPTLTKKASWCSTPTSSRNLTA